MLNQDSGKTKSEDFHLQSNKIEKRNVQVKHITIESKQIITPQRGENRKVKSTMSKNDDSLQRKKWEGEKRENS